MSLGAAMQQWNNWILESHCERHGMHTLVRQAAQLVWRKKKTLAPNTLTFASVVCGGAISSPTLCNIAATLFILHSRSAQGTPRSNDAHSQTQLPPASSTDDHPLPIIQAWKDCRERPPKAEAGPGLGHHSQLICGCTTDKGMMDGLLAIG